MTDFRGLTEEQKVELANYLSEGADDIQLNNNVVTLYFDEHAFNKVEAVHFDNEKVYISGRFSDNRDKTELAEEWLENNNYTD